MKAKLGNRITLCVEIVLTLFIIGMIICNSFENVQQEVMQYESGLQSDYKRLISAYTTDFKMMVNEIIPQIEKDLTFDEMEAFLHSKEKTYESAIGADAYDGISFTYKGGYAHSWDYGEYSDYNPNTRPWYQAAKEGNGEIVVTAPYVTFLNESELPDTDDYIVLTLAQKYNDDISFCYDIKTYAVNELLSKRYNRYRNTFAMMYDANGYIMSCTKPEYYCHNVYKVDEILTDDVVSSVSEMKDKEGKVELMWEKRSMNFVYCTCDESGNYYFVKIPFWSVMQNTIISLFMIGILLIAMEIWIYVRTKRQLETEVELERVKSISETKQEFLARMSHDMRTPMNGILGISELSLEENDTTILRENMEKIHSSGEYLLGLINDTLDLQKIESGKLELKPSIVSARQLMETSVDMIKLSAKEKNIQFVITNKNADIDTYIKIDVMRMRQIFVNLLSNAIKFTPEGGKVELTLEVLGRDGNIVHDCLTVSDTGTGMSEDFVNNQLYKPFSQENNELTNSASGTGLGLSIVKRLVELMGATISVKSELGKGTSFMINIDVECVEKPPEGDNTMQDVKMEKSDIKILEGKSILLAEDHALNAEIATKILQKAGCRITWVENGLECVRAFEKSSAGDYDFILMDIRMPELDGLEAAHRIRAMSRLDAVNIPIIAMSANAYEEDIAKSIQAGMNAHLSKPIQVDKLYETLCRYCKKVS